MDPVELSMVQDGREVVLGRARPRSGCPLQLVDDLARLQLAARRLGWSLRVRSTSADLVGFMALCGLEEVLHVQR